MTRTIARWSGVVVVAVALTGLAAPAVGAAPTPEVKALQKQVKTLKSQVASLRADVAALRAGVAEASAKSDAASTTANAATAKTNCLVNATPLVLWSNDVYVQTPDTLFMDTGLSISTGSDPVSGYVVGVNSSCVPSVFPRAGATSLRTFASHLSAGALLSPH